MDLSQLLASTGDGVMTILFFIIALSVIVAIHEYGHYIVGRWCGISADVFSVGFGPTLLSRVDKRGTRWQIAAIPFGGYVKFAGDKNAASVGGEEVEGEGPARNTMLGAPLWARALTVAAGPIANFILAVFIFAGFFLIQGQPTAKLIVASQYELPVGFESELLAGDEILFVDGIDLMSSEGPYLDSLSDAQYRTYTIIRDGEQIEVSGPNPFVPRIASLLPRSAADDADLKIDDVITAIDGTSVYTFDQIIAGVEAGGGGEITLDVWRDGDVIQLELTPRRVDNPLPDGGFEQRLLIGVTGEYFFIPTTEPVGVIEAFSRAFDRLWFAIRLSLEGIWQVIVGGISTCNISGPIAIAEASGSMASQGATSYILFVGMISVAIGLFNLFPIPILDGGHLVFYAYEAIAGQKPTDRALRVFMSIGLSLIGALMIFAILNDLVLCP